MGSLSCLWLEDQFCLTFPASLETANKATLLGAFFLIDFNYYWIHCKINISKLKDHGVSLLKSFSQLTSIISTMSLVFSDFLCQNIFHIMSHNSNLSLTFHSQLETQVLDHEVRVIMKSKMEHQSSGSVVTYWWLMLMSLRGVFTGPVITNTVSGWTALNN